MKGVKKPKMAFSETGADEHIRVKFKRETSELPNKEAAEYKTPVEFLEGLTRLIYHFKSRGKLFIAKDMIADILTKPLQGSQFIKLRNRLLGYEEAFPNLV